MISRPLASSFAFALALVGLWACSSGLGKDPRRQDDAPTGSNVNLPLGLDVGVLPTDPVAEAVVAGFLVPPIGSSPAREVVFVGFSTAAASNNADGAGTPLSRDPTADVNGAADVFVALVSAQDVERRAFSQSLAGKFRHPRCATCHSMQVDGTTAFVSSASGAGQPHAGPPPGSTFPNNDPATCAPCHVTSNTFPVVGWQAPAASFDIKSKTVAGLAQMAMNVPADETEHFVSDGRVLWALDSGILPQVGGRNGRADDDHDGIFEPEDVDGTPRPVPGGSTVFIQQIEDWRDSGMVVSAAAAVKDVTLVSRQAGTNNAAAGESTAPKLVWVPNPAFNPGNAAATNPIGTLFVAFQSTAGNLTAGDANGGSDVFRAAVQLRAEEDANGAPSAGGLNLVVQNTTLLCSAINGSTNAGNGASGRPAIGGPNAEFIAFESAATNLGFADANGAGLDVYVRKVGANGLGTATQLVSHTIGNQATGGNGSSEAPTISANGAMIHVAFESDASDLINSDLNAVRDVFWADVSGFAPFTKIRASVSDAGAEGTGGACRAASVHVSALGRVQVAFESDKADLDAAVTAATNVFLFDSVTGFTTLLNQQLSSSVTAIGDGPARAPVIAQDGSIVAFESDAMNIDVVSVDENRDGDVFLVETAQVANGLVLPFRISVTTREGTQANGPSMRPSFGTFTGSADFRTGFACYMTDATNLGTSDTTDVIVAFLDQTSGVIADFSATPLLGAAPLPVQFTDLSSGEPTEWSWDFGDGTTSTAQNPLHQYTAPGTYPVTLTARNSISEGSKTELGFVQVVGAVQADFTQDQTQGALPLSVLFTDTSVEENGAITAWLWDFGDGNTSNLQNPGHQYLAEGTFTVTLTVTGLGGVNTVTKTNLITVDPPGPITANFTSVVSSSPLPGRVGTAVGSVYDNETVQFTDTTTGFGQSWSWSFGDGGISALQNPTHVYSTPGTYSVTLTVTGPAGVDGETKLGLITSVASSVQVTLSASKDNSIYSENPDFTNSANPRFVCGNAALLDTVPPIDPPVQQGIRRALIEFDVSSIPASSTILTAALNLTCSTQFTNQTGDQTVSIRRLTREWGEGASGAVAGIGSGTQAVNGEATWNAAFRGTTNWTSPGGDFNATVSASTTVSNVTTGNPQTFVWATTGATSTRADVQLWLDDSTQNHGWILRAGEVSGSRTTKVFDSRTNATVNNRPRLVVTFRPPLP